MVEDVFFQLALDSIMVAVLGRNKGIRDLYLIIIASAPVIPGQLDLQTPRQGKDAINHLGTVQSSRIKSFLGNFLLPLVISSVTLVLPLGFVLQRDRCSIGYLSKRFKVIRYGCCIGYRVFVTAHGSSLVEGVCIREGIGKAGLTTKLRYCGFWFAVIVLDNDIAYNFSTIRQGILQRIPGQFVAVRVDINCPSDGIGFRVMTAAFL